MDLMSHVICITPVIQLADSFPHWFKHNTQCFLYRHQRDSRESEIASLCLRTHLKRVHSALEASDFHYSDGDAITPRRTESSSQHVVSYLLMNAKLLLLLQLSALSLGGIRCVLLIQTVYDLRCLYGVSDIQLSPEWSGTHHSSWSCENPPHTKWSTEPYMPIYMFIKCWLKWKSDHVATLQCMCLRGRRHIQVEDLNDCLVSLNTLLRDAKLESRTGQNYPNNKWLVTCVELFLSVDPRVDQQWVFFKTNSHDSVFLFSRFVE